MIILVLLSLIIRNRFLLLGRMLSLNIKKSISGILFEKLLKTNKSLLARTQPAKFISIVSSDLNALENEFHYISYIVIAPVIVILSLWLISYYFKEASIFGFFAYLLIVTIQIICAKFMIQWRYQESSSSEKRLKFISEAINGIRTIKIFGWEYPYCDLIRKFRKLQVMYCAINHCIAAVGSSLFQNCGYFISFVIFGYHYLKGRDFELSETMFAIYLMSYISFLIIYYSFFGFCTISSFSSILTRIGEIFALEENINHDNSDDLDDKICIQFENASIWWKTHKIENNESEVDSKIILSEINLKIKTNELVVIIGEVGSGKSTFLASILHETPAKEGSIKCRGRIAYVEQEPFIQ